jgi:HSP20 family protein
LAAVPSCRECPYRHLNDIETWIPAVDIREHANRFELYVDLPGIDPAEVELPLDGGVLALSGDRREQVTTTKSGEDLQGRRVERGHGSFHRRFFLPGTVDEDGRG